MNTPKQYKLASLSWDQFASPFFSKSAKPWHIAVPLGGWEQDPITHNFDQLCLNWGLKNHFLDHTLMRNCLQFLAAEPVCKHVLCSSTSQCLCSSPGPGPEGSSVIPAIVLLHLRGWWCLRWAPWRISSLLPLPPVCCPPAAQQPGGRQNHPCYCCRLPRPLHFVLPLL